TFELLQRGDTTGVFQLESGGMRRYLKDLKPNVFEDIIAMVALYRPGPMDLIPDYIARKFGRQRIEYIHPKLEPILKNTYGVGVYQEQMMQIARDLAGFTLAQADTLRKAIGKKIKELLDEQQEMLISGMVATGIDEKTANAIWELFPPFARYGFNRSHAACYAQVAYQTAYLKTHYPTEFMAALLNAESKNIERLSFLIDEADTHNIKVLPPSINESGQVFTVASDNTIRFGLAAIKNVGSNVVARIIEERETSGPFTSLENFMERVIGREFNKKSLESLTKAGALDSFGERNRILENMDTLLHYAREYSATAASGQTFLFGETSEAPMARLTLREAAVASEKEQLEWEKELLGFYVSGHPLRAYRDKMVGCTPIHLLATYRYPSVKIAALVSTTKKIITKKGDPMLFFGIEDLTGKIEAIAFPKTFASHQEILIEGKVLILEGKIDAKDGEPKFLCERVKEIT
ncbi:MAG: DNA polymerase III subunit alpha, partial [Candidatus Spechtbacterales bacterium]